MRKRPGLNALSMFDAAARHLNFRKASEEMNITQGAVAQQVRKLEASLGVKLFARNARGLELTKNGELYHQSIEKALDLIDKATEQIVQQQDVIRISVTPSIASKWLVPLLPEFSQRYPKIAVDIIASETVTRFEKQDIDLAIRQSAKPIDSDLDIELLAPVELYAVCGSQNPISKSRTRFELGDFKSMALIQDGHRYWEKLFQEAEIKRLNTYLQFNQTALAMDAAQNGQG
ncbi:MAG: LysR substrate-binding domain-containing protein, partial [Sneathiellales bacterium]|nr:LysR substrate-binding domain-containing protein [Sneathiellales bacterium]